MTLKHGLSITVRAGEFNIGKVHSSAASFVRMRRECRRLQSD